MLDFMCKRSVKFSEVVSSLSLAMVLDPNEDVILAPKWYHLGAEITTLRLRLSYQAWHDSLCRRSLALPLGGIYWVSF